LSRPWKPPSWADRVPGRVGQTQAEYNASLLQDGGILADGGILREVPPGWSVNWGDISGMDAKRRREGG